MLKERYRPGEERLMSRGKERRRGKGRGRVHDGEREVIGVQLGRGSKEGSALTRKGIVSI